MSNIMAHASRSLTSLTSRLTKLIPRSRSLPGTFSPKRTVSGDVSFKSRILGQSTILLQDGIDITELPVIIRRLDKSLIPVGITSHMPSLDYVQKMTEREAVFKLRLQQCSTVKEVFRLLEIPGDHVTAYTAAFALIRVCQLRLARNDLEEIDSFIQAAVMKDLCDTVSKGIKVLTNETVVSLVNCYMTTSCYLEGYADKINEEVECRIGDSRFSVPELNSLVHHLSSNQKGNPNVLDSIYIHLSSRTQEIDELNITDTYCSLALNPKSNAGKCTVKAIDKRLLKCWWKLTSQDCAKILTYSVQMNHKSFPILNSMGKLVFINIHDFQDRDLMHVVMAYIHFSFTDTNMFNALERYLMAKVEKVDTNLVALVMEYCRTRRILSTKIFDVAAAHIEKNGDLYDSDHLFSILRPFGQLNYMPKTIGPLFLKIEEYIFRHFDEFSSEKLLELLASFAYIERFPINFVRKVFTPYMYSLVNMLKDEQQCLQAQYHLLLLQSAIKLEWRDCRVPYLFISEDFSQYRKWSTPHKHYMVQEVKDHLLNIVETDSIREGVLLERSPFVIDLAIHSKDKIKFGGKLAIVLTWPEHCCVNSSSLLGEYAMRLRHIKLHGYSTAEVIMDEYKPRNKEEKAEYLREMLGPYIKSDTT